MRDESWKLPGRDVPVLAVAVVLDHEGAGACSPVEQRQATFERQDRAGRELVGRGDVDEARPAGPSRQLGRIETVTIDRDGNQASAGSREDLACGWIVRILDRDAVVGIDEHARDQVEGLLRSTAALPNFLGRASGTLQSWF